MLIFVNINSGGQLFRYETTFVFNNDFPALLEDVPEPEDTGDPLFK